MKFNKTTGNHELELQDVHDEDIIDWLRGTLALDEEDPLILFPENIQHIIRAVDAQSGKKMSLLDVLQSHLVAAGNCVGVADELLLSGGVVSEMAH